MAEAEHGHRNLPPPFQLRRRCRLVGLVGLLGLLDPTEEHERPLATFDTHNNEHHKDTVQQGEEKERLSLLLTHKYTERTTTSSVGGSGGPAGAYRGE